MVVQQSGQPSRSAPPRRRDQHALSETSTTENGGESGLDTEALTTALLESLEAADLPFAEQAELLASLLPDDASRAVPGRDTAGSLAAAYEALTPEEVEAELADSLSAAGVPAAEMPALLASLLPEESAATAPAAPAVAGSLATAYEALTPEEVEAELADSLSAAGVSTEDLALLVEHLVPQRESQP
jgi:hypothetical protein